MHRPLLGLALLLAALAGHAEVIDIDNAQLAGLLEEGIPLVDVRLQAEWEETGIVGGSKLLTFFDERGGHDDRAWLVKLQPFAKANQPVIVICRSGNRTRAVSRFLSREAGYATVYNVKSGIKDWIAAGRPVVPAGPALAACRAAKTC